MDDKERQLFGRYLSERANALRQELEAIDELVNELGKPFTEATPTEKPIETQFNGLNWTTKEGTRGNYEQTANDNSEAFKTLSAYVKAKGGFVTFHGFKAWIHNNDPNLIDRKR